tara:strand:- start:15138 stop:16412 length:1275 start_codon:yes stop_codon:yes gene_type:complete
MKSANLAMHELREAVMRIPADKITADRTSALARLGAGELPTLRHEDWKYTDLRPAVDISNRWLAAGASNSHPDSLDATISGIRQSIEANWLVIANGVVDTSQFDAAAGVRLQRFSESSPPENPATPLSNLNVALLNDGVRLEVHAATEKPIGLLIIDSSESAVTVSQANLAIEIAAGCDAEIIEYQSSSGEFDNYCNSSITLQIDEGAKARYVRIQDRDVRHTHTARLDVRAGAGSELDMAGYDIGGGLVRNDVDIELNQPGANVRFNGLYLAGDGQHIDNHTRVDHKVGPASSFQEYRGILNGKCRCVWNGKAVVHKGADGTDANQANHNLLLSDKAEIDAKPELEIYADEVKCSHGTTVGQLDKQALFYLRTRGLNRAEAKQLLTHAFAADLVRRAPVAAARDTVAALVNRKLSALTENDPL